MVNRTVKGAESNRIRLVIEMELDPEVRPVYLLSLLKSNVGDSKIGVASFTKSKLSLPAGVVRIVDIATLKPDNKLERLKEGRAIYRSGYDHGYGDGLGMYKGYTCITDENSAPSDEYLLKFSGGR